MVLSESTHIDAGFQALKSIYHVQKILCKIAAKLKTRPKLCRIRYHCCGTGNISVVPDLVICTGSDVGARPR